MSPTGFRPNRIALRIVRALDEYAGAAGLRASDRKRLLDHIDEQLTHQPTEETRNKKVLVGLVPPWEHEEPIRELRVGEHRIFYDADEASRRVIVRAIRHKPPHETTEEVL